MTDPNRLPLDGTVALVTGASSGIGESTAVALSAAGAHVVAAARRADRLHSLVGRITRSGGRALAVAADLAQEDQAHATVTRAVEEFGRLDIVVANAGVMLLGPLEGADTAEWRRMLEINTFGVMHTCHAAIPHLLSAAADDPRHVADLVLVSSTAGRQVRSGSGVYSASKHALTAFGEALRLELTGRHVRTALVEPGAVDTELPTHNRPEIQQALNSRFATMQRLRADDVSDTIMFITTRPRHVTVNEVLVRPTSQQD
jgi:NADP-dependent 3-hydroxy acid dehydrogenase YdfG